MRLREKKCRLNGVLCLSETGARCKPNVRARKLPSLSMPLWHRLVDSGRLCYLFVCQILTLIRSRTLAWNPYYPVQQMT